MRGTSCSSKQSMYVDSGTWLTMYWAMLASLEMRKSPDRGIQPDSEVKYTALITTASSC